MVFHEGHVLPTVRIQNIEINHFKSVRHGEILLNCGRKFIPQDTDSDILGIYGQNGSGKTSVIEAIAILEKAMSGDRIPPRYAECIAEGEEYAELSFTFDLQYPCDNSFNRTIYYSFKIGTLPNDPQDDREAIVPLSSLYPKKIFIFDETISASGLFDGVVQKKQPILTTNGNNYPIGPVRKIQQYVGEEKEKVIVDLAVNQRTALKESRSFVFMEETLELFYQHSNYSEYYQILMELHNYASLYLYSVDTRSAGLGTVLIFNTRYGILPLNLMKATRIPQRLFEELNYFLLGINKVLPTLVANLKLEIVHDEIVIEGEEWQEVKLFSRRAETMIPVRDESAGIIKLVSILSLIIAVFNDRSITVAVDELDAGIYEYLLGEILSGLEKYGKGQFIFTSHNLRPLEVLKKESIIFTTSNPDNRYIRLKGIGRTNNLRSLYLREIIGNTQDEQIYDAEKRQRMIAAFLKAGVGIAQKE